MSAAREPCRTLLRQLLQDTHKFRKAGRSLDEQGLHDAESALANGTEADCRAILAGRIAHSNHLAAKGYPRDALCEVKYQQIMRVLRETEK